MISYHRYKLNCIVEDEKDQINFLILGKIVQNSLGVSCYKLVIEQGYDNPHILTAIVSQMIGTTKNFQISFGNLKNGMNKHDLLVSTVFADDLQLMPPIIQSLEEDPYSLSKQILKKSNQNLLSAKHFPTTLASSTHASIVTPITPPSSYFQHTKILPLKAAAPLKRSLFTSTNEIGQELDRLALKYFSYVFFLFASHYL